MSLKKFINNTEDIQNAILGTIFADGYISKKRTNNGNSNLEITHTSKNLDYLKVLKELLELLPNCKCSITQHNKVSENKTYFLYRLSTNRSLYFSELRKDIYINNIKTFKKEYINKFNLLSLFLMYLDDGSFRIRYYENTNKIREVRTTFCLDSFHISELQYFQYWLKNTYNIETKLYRHSKMNDLERGFRIWTNTENSKKLMTLFDEYYDCIPSMNYKFLKYYSS